MRQRKVPLRKCVACQEMKPKRDLIRIVRTPENEISIDPTGKRSGRGAYVCKQLECFQLAGKNRALDKSFRQAVPMEIYQKLQTEYIQHTEKDQIEGQ